MKTAEAVRVPRMVVYPTSDGKPMAETDLHRDLMIDVIDTLRDWFAADPMTYVSGNMLVYFEKGNKRKHISPDVFFVRGVPKHDRDYYLIWEERIAPQAVIEITSSSTRREDLVTKKAKYRDILKVKEYFLFDPREEYLEPSFQAFRLVKGEYVPIEPIGGHFASKVLGLHLVRDGRRLRFIDPATGRMLPTRSERIAAAEARVARVDAENEQLRQQLGNLQRRISPRRNGHNGD